MGIFNILPHLLASAYIYIIFLFWFQCFYHKKNKFYVFKRFIYLLTYQASSSVYPGSDSEKTTLLLLYYPLFLQEVASKNLPLGLVWMRMYSSQSTCVKID
jgi:hypothetical protein